MTRDKKREEERRREKNERVLVLHTAGAFYAAIPDGCMNLRVPNLSGSTSCFVDYGQRDLYTKCRIFEPEDALVSVMREKFGG